MVVSANYSGHLTFGRCKASHRGVEKKDSRWWARSPRSSSPAPWRCSHWWGKTWCSLPAPATPATPRQTWGYFHRNPPAAPSGERRRSDVLYEQSAALFLLEQPNFEVMEHRAHHNKSTAALKSHSCSIKQGLDLNGKPTGRAGSAAAVHVFMTFILTVKQLQRGRSSSGR